MFTRGYVFFTIISGWWFQTFFIFHFIYGMSSFPLTTVNVYQRVAKRSISCIPGRRTRHVRRGAWESHDPPWCWLGVLALIGSEIYSCHVLGTQCLTHYPLVNVYKKLWKITIFQLVNPLCLWSFLISYAIYGNIYHQYIYIPQMLAYIPYMDPMGLVDTCFFPWQTKM